MIALQYELLGPVQVRCGDGPVALSGRLQQVLLGVLLVNANREVGVDVLADAMWGERRDDRMAQKLQLHVHRLRRLLGEADRVSFGRDGYRLRVEPGELDAERFTTLADDAFGAVRDDPAQAATLLRAALGLWRGMPFGGLDVPLFATEAARLSERRITAVEELYAAELSCGRHAAVVGELAEAITEHPLRERLYGLQMTALYRGGRQAAALEVFRQARGTLVAELGLEPGPELRALERQILAGEPIEHARAEPVSHVPAQLPHDVHGFVGRTSELSELDSVVEGAPRVCLLTGTAGVGKTALATHWAHRMREAFPDGQLYVDLCGYGPERPLAPEAALAGFLRALGVDGAQIPADSAQRAALFRTLVNGKRLLIVLDNAARPAQLRPLLPGTASCLVLATSRDSLAGLVAREGAHRIALNRLPVGEAIGLLRTLAGPDIGEDTATPALIERCARLPVALRVVAEQIKTGAYGVGELAAELTGERDRLDLLDADGDEQSSVRAVFSWSYRQLSTKDAELFVFGGLHPGRAFDVHTLAALAGRDPRPVKRGVETLLRAHLVDAEAPGRFVMHDLLRAYAAERAATELTEPQRQAAMDRMLDWYLHTAWQARRAVDRYVPTPPLEPLRQPPDALTFADGPQATRWYEVERPNLVAAIRAAVETGRVDRAWKLCAALLSFFYLGNHWDDWIESFELTLELVRAHGERLGEARLLNGLGVGYDDLDRFADAEQCHLRAEQLYDELGDRHGQAWNLNNLGVVYDNMCRFDQAEQRYLAALALFRELGDPRGEGMSLNNLGDLTRQLGRFDEASDYLRRALRVQRTQGDGEAVRYSLRTLGDLQCDVGRYDEAIAAYQECLVAAEPVGERWRTAAVRAKLADLLDRAGRADEAREYRQDAYEIFTELGDRRAAELRARLDVPC